MDLTGWTDRLAESLASANEAHLSRAEANASVAYDRAVDEQADIFRSLVAEGSPEDSVRAELQVLEFEVKRYVLDVQSRTSLKAGADRMKALLLEFTRVRDPASYRREVDRFHIPETRRGGLPLDQAHRHLSSHHTRLRNARTDQQIPSRNEFCHARMQAMGSIRKGYEALQALAIGLDRSNERGGHGRGLPDLGSGEMHAGDRPLPIGGG